MRLRKPCEHGRYESHYANLRMATTSTATQCPGGEFLADDALVIEKVDGEWPERFDGMALFDGRGGHITGSQILDLLVWETV